MASAQEPLASVDRTDVIAARCATCHDTGAAREGVPSIAGRPSPEIADKLRAYRDAGPKRDVMTTRASRLADADIDALARYFAALPSVRRPD